MIVGDSDDGLNDLVRALIGELQEELTELDRRIAGYDRKIRELYRNSEICQRLGKIEGIGPVTATALIVAVGDPKLLQEWPSVCGMAWACAEAAIEWRPRPIIRHQQTRRPLSAHLADPRRSRRVGRVGGKQDPRSLWLGKMRQRRHPNVVAVALANKNARIVWAMLSSDNAYEPALSVKAA